VKKALISVARITVDMLRADRLLRAEIKGELSASLRGDVSGIRGDVSNLRGDVSDLSGNVSDLSGNVSGLRGDVSGLSGDVSDLSGDIDDCELADDERSAGVDVADLAIS